MQFHLITFLVALFCASALAVNSQRPIIITYPANTPQSFIDKAMDTLRGAGGVITHEYSLIKGFAAKASDSTIEAVKALGEEFLPVVEDDRVVSTNGKIKNN